MFVRARTSLIPALAVPTLALFAVLVLETTGHASLLVSLSPSVELKLASPGRSDSASSSSHSTRDQEEFLDSAGGPFSIEYRSLTCSLPPGDSTGGMSSSSGTSGASGVFCRVCCTTLLQKDRMIRWFVSEYSLAIPDPPGRDLIRPPQGHCNADV